MEKMNLNFNGTDNIFKSICWILSVLSWLFFLITGWIAVIELLKDFDILTYIFTGVTPYIWVIRKITLISGNKVAEYANLALYMPFQMLDIFLYIIFFILIIAGTIAFLVYVFLSTCKKTSDFDNGMLGKVTRFHFIPLLCAGALFLIGLTLDDYKDKKGMFIASLVFSIVGLLASILISYNCNIVSPIYAQILLKKATFGTLIALFTYNLCYSIARLRTTGESKGLYDFLKGCGIAFPIVVGVFNLIIGFFVKDGILAIMNGLIHLGATIFYFKLNEDIREEFNKSADGIINVVMLVLSIATAALIVIRNKMI